MTEVNKMESAEPGTYFWQGSKACAEAAITARCRFFSGYPITPASKILEHMAKRLPQVGGITIQMEDEMASIGAVIGASWTGTKAMTATSGPGFSLMQEFIGYAFMTETPCVIVDVQRVGPSTGQATKCAQGDVMQSRWGTHGDYPAIVLSPNCVQEMFTLTIRAFNLAEKFRTPVIVLSDETVAHVREQITVPPLETLEIIDRSKPETQGKIHPGLEEVPPTPPIGKGFNVAVTGSTHDEYGVRFTADPLIHRRLVRRLNDKITNHEEEISDIEVYNIADCKLALVSYGCTSRAIYETVEKAEAKGIKIGFVRLRTIWPFPDKTVRELAEEAVKIIVPELNVGQIVNEVKRAVNGSAEVIPLNKIGGGELITPEEILTEVLKEAERND